MSVNQSEVLWKDTIIIIRLIAAIVMNYYNQLINVSVFEYFKVVIYNAIKLFEQYYPKLEETLARKAIGIY